MHKMQNQKTKFHNCSKLSELYDLVWKYPGNDALFKILDALYKYQIVHNSRLKGLEGQTLKLWLIDTQQ